MSKKIENEVKKVFEALRWHDHLNDFCLVGKAYMTVGEDKYKIVRNDLESIKYWQVWKNDQFIATVEKKTGRVILM